MLGPALSLGMWCLKLIPTQYFRWEWCWELSILVRWVTNRASPLDAMLTRPSPLALEGLKSSL